MKKKGSQALVIYTSIIILLFIGVVIINQVSNKDESSQVVDAAPDLAGQPILGDQDAKVTIVEFGDYKCPSCKAWGEQILPKLTESYIDTGKANFSYVNVLFHGQESILGALAGEAILQQSPQSFWLFHKELFAAQPSADHDALWLTPEKVMEIAGSLEIDTNQLQQDVTTPEVKGRVDRDQELVNSYNVTQTPTIMINDVLITNPFDYDTIIKVIEEQSNK